MAIQSHTVKIDDKTFIINTFNTTLGGQYLLIVSDIFGDSLPQIVSVMDGEAGAEQAMAEGMSAVISKMRTEKAPELMKEMICACVLNGSQMMDTATYEVTFSGELHVLVKLFIEILKVNYSSLLKLGATQVSNGSLVAPTA